MKFLFGRCLCFLSLIFSCGVSAQQGWFIDAEYDTPWYDITISPHAAYKNGSTYITYQGRSGDPYVMKFDHQGNRWSGPSRVGRNELPNFDTHGNPALFFDASDRLNIIYGGHGDAGDMFRARAADANSIERFIDAGGIDSFGTYPNIGAYRNGSIVYMFRNGGHKSAWVETASQDGARFGNKQSILDEPDATNRIYYMHSTMGSDNKFYVAYSRLKNTDKTGGLRQNLYVIYREQDGTWRNVAGTRLNDFLPLSWAESDSHALVFDTEQSNQQVNMGMIAVVDGRPVILFYIADLKKNNKIYHTTRWTGSGWTTPEPIHTTFASDAALNQTDDGVLEILLTERDRERVFLYRSRDKGRSWNQVRTVFANLNAWDITPVLNAHNDAKFAFVNNRKLYLWGDSGLVRANGLDNPAPLPTPSASPTPLPAQDFPWRENFDLTDGSREDLGDTSWRLTFSGARAESCAVNESRLRCSNTRGEVLWSSGVIDTSSALGTVRLSTSITGEGTLDDGGKFADYLEVSYSLNGGPEQRLARISGEAPSGELISALTGRGDTQLYIRARVSAQDESYHIDYVNLEDTGLPSEPSPVPSPQPSPIVTPQPSPVASPVPVGNLIGNPGFENDSVWSGRSMEFVRNERYQDERSLKVSSWGRAEQVVALTQVTDNFIELFYKGRNGRVRLTYLNDGGEEISNVTKNLGAAANWSLQRMTFDPPASASGLRVSLGKQYSQGTAYYDAVSLN